jgi:site-specific DNA recombinase
MPAVQKQYRIGIYVRESRDDNFENIETIQTQRDLLIDYSKVHFKGEISRIYIDDNVSGSDFKRNGLLQLKNDAQSGVIDLVLLKDLSRLGRSNAKTLLFLDELEEFKVRVISSDGRYDSDLDNETAGIDAWYNERYVKDISKKIRSTLKFKIKKGEYIGKAPFGYTKSKTFKNRLEINYQQYEIIKEIYDKYIKGLGYKAISNYLNSLCISAPGGAGAKWNGIAVRRILSNKVYLGHTIQGISEKISFKSKKTRRLPEESWSITENTHPPIIEQTTFDKVQTIIAQKRNYNGQHKGTLHLFKGLLFCNECGSGMIARIRNKKVGYICGSYARDGVNICTSHFISEDFLIEILIDEVMRLLKSEKINIALALYKEAKNRNILNISEIKNIKNQIEMKNKKLDIMYSDRLSGTITEQMYLDFSIRIKQSIDSLEKTVLSLEREVDSSELDYLTDNYFLNLFKINKITNELSRILIDRIIISQCQDNRIVKIKFN